MTRVQARKYARQLGLTCLRLHSLRHTFGTRLIAMGYDFGVVKDLSGVDYKGWFDAFLLVDNGQGANASNADLCSWIYCELRDNCDYVKTPYGT